MAKTNERGKGRVATQGKTTPAADYTDRRTLRK